MWRNMKKEPLNSALHKIQLRNQKDTLLFVCQPATTLVRKCKCKISISSGVYRHTLVELLYKTPKYLHVYMYMCILDLCRLIKCVCSFNL